MIARAPSARTSRPIRAIQSPPVRDAASQVLLANPIGLLGYTAATWYFFYDRIPHEEALLVRFFGEPYHAYRKRTVIGIPFLAWALERK